MESSSSSVNQGDMISVYCLFTVIVLILIEIDLIIY
jgi:hypothetical protein